MVREDPYSCARSCRAKVRTAAPDAPFGAAKSQLRTPSAAKVGRGTLASWSPGWPSNAAALEAVSDRRKAGRIAPSAERVRTRRGDGCSERQQFGVGQEEGQGDGARGRWRRIGHRQAASKRQDEAPGAQTARP